MSNSTIFLPSEQRAYLLLSRGCLSTGTGSAEVRAAGNQIIALAEQIKAERAVAMLDR